MTPITSAEMVQSIMDMVQSPISTSASPTIIGAEGSLSKTCKMFNDRESKIQLGCAQNVSSKEELAQLQASLSDLGQQRAKLQKKRPFGATDLDFVGLGTQIS